MPVSEDTLEHTLADFGALSDTVTLHAGLGKLLLLFLEPPDTRAVGQTREQEETSNSDRKTDDTVDNEHPAP